MLFESVERQKIIIEKLGWKPQLHVIQGSGTTPHVRVDGKMKRMFCSNNYLGLTNNETIISRTIDVLKEHGLGPGGSRLLCGNVEIIERMERKIAEFAGVEAIISFPTGYMANLAVFQGVMDPLFDEVNDFPRGVIFSDEHNHATIVDGCRLSASKKIAFKHNNWHDLTIKMSEFSSATNKLIVTQSVFSIDGELTNILEAERIAKENGAGLMIDDAHGIGVIGRGGRGVISQFELKEPPDIYMASLDKAIGVTGGILGGKKGLIEYLKFAARPGLFSSAIPAVMAAGTIAAIEKIESNPAIIIDLLKKSRRVRTELTHAGLTILGDDKVPIIPILTGSEEVGIEFERRLFEEGIFATCFRVPAAPVGMSRIRVVIMANHSEEDLDYLVACCRKVAKEMKLIN